MDDSDALVFDFNLSLATVLLVVDFIIRVLAIIYVPRNRRPQTALAWLLGPYALMAGTAAAALVMLRREFASASRRVIHSEAAATKAPSE